MSDWVGWIELLGGAAVLAGADLAIYEGARRILLNGRLTRGATLMLAAGLLLPLYEGAVSLTVPARVRQQVAEQSALRAPEPSGGWEKMPGTAEQRSTLSANAATINFMVSGQLGPYLDASGQRVTLVPTQQQLQAREALVRDEKGAEDTAELLFERGAQLLVMALVAVLLGVAVGLAQRRRAGR